MGAVTRATIMRPCEWRHHHPPWPGAHDGGVGALLAHNDVRHLHGTGLEPSEA